MSVSNKDKVNSSTSYIT